MYNSSTLCNIFLAPPNLVTQLNNVMKALMNFMKDDNDLEFQTGI